MAKPLSDCRVLVKAAQSDTSFVPTLRQGSCPAIRPAESSITIAAVKAICAIRLCRFPAKKTHSFSLPCWLGGALCVRWTAVSRCSYLTSLQQDRPRIDTPLHHIEVVTGLWLCARGARECYHALPDKAREDREHTRSESSACSPKTDAALRFSPGSDRLPWWRQIEQNRTSSYRRYWRKRCNCGLVEKRTAPPVASRAERMRLTEAENTDNRRPGVE